MKIWRRTDHELFKLGRQVSGHAMFLIGLALAGAPFVLALVAAWIGFAVFAALGQDYLGLLTIFALLVFLWRYVYVPVVAPAVTRAANVLRIRRRAHR